MEMGRTCLDLHFKEYTQRKREAYRSGGVEVWLEAMNGGHGGQCLAWWTVIVVDCVQI